MTLRRAERNHVCPACGYSLHGHPAGAGTCPECGTSQVGPLAWYWRTRAWRFELPAVGTFSALDPSPCLAEAARRAVAWVVLPGLVFGFLLLAGSSIVVDVTYRNASSGKTYTIPWRPFELNLRSSMFDERVVSKHCRVLLPDLSRLQPQWLALGAVPFVSLLVGTAACGLCLRGAAPGMSKRRKALSASLVAASLLLPGLLPLVAVANGLAIAGMLDVLFAESAALWSHWPFTAAFLASTVTCCIWGVLLLLRLANGLWQRGARGRLPVLAGLLFWASFVFLQSWFVWCVMGRNPYEMWPLS